MQFWQQLIFASLALGALFPGSAAGAGLERLPDGRIQAGEYEFKIVHWGKGWTGTPLSDKTVSFPGESGEAIPGRGIKRVGEFKVHGGAFHLTDIVDASRPDELTQEYAVDSPAPIPTEALAFVTTIPTGAMQRGPLRVNGRPLAFGPTLDAKKTWFREVVKKGDRCELPTREGVLELAGDFVLYLQDNRSYGQDHAEIRLLFSPPAGSGLKHAAFKLHMRMRPYRVAELDLRPAMNMGFRDEADGDQKGGWTDQGADNDLRALAPGQLRVDGLPFSVTDPQQNGGRSCIVLRGAARPYFPAEAVIPGNGVEGRSLYLLNALAWPPQAGAVCGAVEIRYQNGEKQMTELKRGIDTDNFWNPRPLPQAQVGWSGQNHELTVGLFVSRIPLKEQPVGEIRFLSRNAVWGIVAASVAEADLISGQQKEFTVTAGPEWGEVRENRNIVKGSIIDFSDLLDAPAGKYGFCRVVGDHFEFADRPGKPVRFWGGNILGTAIFMEADEVDRMLDDFAATGMNMVRLHHFDQSFLGQALTRKLGAQESARRFDYFVSACKKRGLYLTLDLQTTLTIGSQEMDGEKVTSPEYRVLVYFDPRVRRHLLNFARLLLTHPNAFTGVALKDDPALAFIHLVNESVLPDSGRGSPLTTKILEKGFREKLGSRVDSLNEAERTEAWNRFVREGYFEGYDAIKNALRGMGVKIPLTDLNLLWKPRVSALREPLDFVDNHTYWGHPVYMNAKDRWLPPIAVSPASAIASCAGAFNTVAPTRRLSQPFTITEWDYVVPNPYHVEGAFLMGAYSAFQNDSGLCRFSWASWSEHYRENPSVHHFFDFAKEPLVNLSMRAGSCFFLRGDVEPGRTVVPYLFSGRDMDGANYNSSFPEVMEKLALLVRTGLVYPSDPLPPGTVACLAAPDETRKTGVPTFTGAYAEEVLPQMARDGVLSGRLFDLPASRFTSSTGELELIGQKKSLRIVTPRSEGFVLDAGDALRGKFAEVRAPSTFCAVLVASRDGKELAQSERVLILHLTDSKGNGVTFSDPDRSIIADWGKPGMLMRRGSAELRLNAPANRNLYACDVTGKRLFPVAFTRDRENRICFTAENFRNGEAICVYELIREN